jgi:predicted polyphosphate/ATP-dependent NAD kinase
MSVGVVANPASGRDIRRLVTGASVFDNAEKGSMVFRLLAGLGATGVEKVWMMPAGEGLSGSLVRRMRSHTRHHAADAARMPVLEFLDMPMRGDARDSVEATRMLVDLGVGAIVVLGGDGTGRAVAKACGGVPLCALSTGTNNAFPYLMESTVAGIATGLVTTGRVPHDVAMTRHKRLDVRCGEARDLALVDVAASSDRFIGARALWRVANLSDAVVTFADPGAVGLSGIAGQVHQAARTGDHGLYLRLGDPAHADAAVTVALAPGLVAHVGVSDVREIGFGEVVELPPADGCLALDGEREIERDDTDTVTVVLAPGPLVIDVDAVMTHAAANSTLVGGVSNPEGGT